MIITTQNNETIHIVNEDPGLSVKILISVELQKQCDGKHAKNTDHKIMIKRLSYMWEASDSVNNSI